MKKILGISVKQQGVSMIIGLAVSFIVLGITLSILFLSEKYREQSQNINLSNQTFFTLEAGQEAAIFHHNARGKGVHFEGTIDSVGSDQTVQISPTNTAKWILRGRTQDLSNNDVLTGLLGQNQVVQIPFSWDPSSNISQAPDTTNITDLNFDLTFGRYTFDSDGNATTNEVISSTFDFGAANDEILINWALSKIDTSGNLTTFIPQSTLTGLIYCDTIGPNTGFFCESNFGESIRPDMTIPGYILPGKTPTSFTDFYSDDDGNGANFTISFQPLLSFLDSNGTDKIEGIPWAFEITNANNGFPKHFYEMEIQANIGDFQKTLIRDILEKTSLQGLDTAVID